MEHDHEPRHSFRPSPLFERRGDRMVTRGVCDDRPYERIFRLKLWLALSLAINLVFGLWLALNR